MNLETERLILEPITLELVEAVLAGMPAAPCGVAMCVPAPYLAQVGALLAGRPVALGAQDVSAHASGAYTGEAADIYKKLATDAGLNEILLERAELGHTIRIDVSLDGEPFTPYVADGVMIATPTGSTAYAFSARGPIVDPRHRAQVLVPVSPHMLFDRALVLAPDAVVRMTVAGGRPAHLSVDGHSGGTLDVGDAVVCTADPVPARLVRFGPPSFQRVLKTKFGLPDR